MQDIYSLVGMVIVVYENELYIYIVICEKFFVDIKVVLFVGFDVIFFFRGELFILLNLDY